MNTQLSEAALNLLRRLVDGDDVPVSSMNRDAYKELAAAGIVEQVGSFTRQFSYRLTAIGYEQREELLTKNS